MGGQQGWFTRQIKVGQSSVANVAKITEIDCYTVNVDPAIINAGENKTTLFAATQAAIGDFCLVAGPVELQDMNVTAYVLDAGNIELSFNSGSLANAGINLAAGLWKVLLIKAG